MEGDGSSKKKNNDKLEKALKDAKDLLKVMKNKKKKPSKPRIINLKRDSTGRRTYPYKGQHRHRSIKNISNPCHEYSTNHFAELLEDMESEETQPVKNDSSLEEIMAIKCSDCKKYLCSKCDTIIHEKYPLHNRVTYIDGYPFALSPTEVVTGKEISGTIRFIPLVPNPCINCGSWNCAKEATKDQSIIVTLTGRFELFQYNLVCLECGYIQNPFTIKKVIESGFWSTSPKKYYTLITSNVLQMWDNLRKHMPGTSEKAFLDSLNDLTLINGRNGKILPSSFSNAFKEYCFCNYELEKIQQKKWMECPCCSIKQHSCHVDGNCKLYRYRNSGCRRRDTYYSESFIEPDLKVDSFVKSVYKSSTVKEQSDFTCGGDWKAAKNVQRKKNSVDITGLEVAACRHQFAQKALNMHQGELYAYPLYLIKHHMIPHNVEYVFADVMCKLWKFLCRKEPSIANSIKGALSRMHAKGHSLQCQVNWDGDWIEGTGRSTGEECEQLFSYLSRASNSTKYQRPENREETITELAMFWNKRKTNNISNALAVKYKRISNDFDKKGTELTTLCNSLNIVLSDIQWNDWLKEVQISASSDMLKLPTLTKAQAIILLYDDLKFVPPNSSVNVKDKIQTFAIPDLSLIKIPLLSKTKQEKQRLLIDYWDSFEKEDLKKEYTNLTKCVIIPAFRIAIEKCYFEKVHWQTQLKKVADTCKQRTIYRKKMSTVASNLKSLIPIYQQFTSSTPLVNKIEAGNFPWRKQSLTTSLIPDEDKRLVLATHMKMKRSEEELSLIKRDMESYLQYYNEKANELKTKINSMEEQLPKSINKDYIFGYISLLRQGLCFVEAQQVSAVTSFSNILPPDTAFVDLSDYSININENLGELEEEVEIENEEENIRNDSYYEEVDIDLIIESGDEIASKYIGPLCFEIYIGKVVQWVLPSCFSQSTINGRNGSNACAVISLLAGYAMSKCDFFQPNNIDKTRVVKSYVGCLEVGNSLYEEGDDLLVPEALAILPDTLQMDLINESNVTIDTIETDICTNVNDFFVLTAGGSTICCMHMGGNYYVFNSHIHGEQGAMISFAPIDTIKCLIESTLTIQSDDIIYICYITVDSDDSVFAEKNIV